MQIAFIKGLERAVIQYKIDQNPTTSGDLRQLASEMDAKMLAGSRVGWAMYRLGKSIGVKYYIQGKGYQPLTQNH